MYCHASVTLAGTGASFLSGSAYCDTVHMMFIIAFCCVVEFLFLSY